MTSLMPYYGGKSRLAEHIIAEFPEHHCYVETCGGSAAVLLQKQPSPVEVLNDRDDDLVHFYRVLRERPGDLLHALRHTPYARAEHDRCRRALATGSLVGVERARCYYVATCQSYSGLVGDAFSRSRTKRSAATWRNRIDGLPRVVERLRPVLIENRDAVDLIAAYDGRGTLFYVDPPYDPAVRTGRRERNAGKYRYEMTADDHCALLTALNRAKGKVLLSGYDSNLYSRLLKGWRVVWRKDVQMVSATSLNRRDSQRRTEVLWANF